MAMSVVAGNWKMNTTLEEAKNLASEIRNSLGDTEGVETIICPPSISLDAIKSLLEGSKIALGAQNLYPEEKGAFTGEVSPSMLTELCQYVILGHSERRQLFGEDYAFINRKVKAAQSVGLKPILCVGEELRDREAGQAEELIESQVRDGLAGVQSTTGVIVAYEPIWAIGTGQAATPEIAQNMMSYIRKVLVQMFGPDKAYDVPLLYGGSCNSENCTSFFRQKDIDGALVGGASLNAQSFSEMVRKRAAVPF